jgi:hypothetical protein
VVPVASLRCCCGAPRRGCDARLADEWRAWCLWRRCTLRLHVHCEHVAVTPDCSSTLSEWYAQRVPGCHLELQLYVPRVTTSRLRCTAVVSHSHEDEWSVVPVASLHVAAPRASRACGCHSGLQLHSCLHRVVCALRTAAPLSVSGMRIACPAVASSCNSTCLALFRPFPQTVKYDLLGVEVNEGR